MINIQQIKETSEKILSFQKSEWKLADVEYFGEIIDWTKEKVILTANDNGELAGVLECTIMAGVMWIDSLIVKHTKHRQGIGTSFMKSVEEISRKKNVHKMILTTSQTLNTIKFYESLGFTKVGEYKNHYKHKDYVIYSKFL